MAGDEAILAKQRYFQSVHKLTHLKSPSDKITSLFIPFAFVGIGALMMVTSTMPFSEPFSIDPNNPPTERDYATKFQSLKPGVIGKEALEAVSV